MMDEGHNNTGRPKKLTFRMLVKPENPITKIECCDGGYKFSYGHDF